MNQKDDCNHKATILSSTSNVRADACCDTSGRTNKGYDCTKMADRIVDSRIKAAKRESDSASKAALNN